MMNLMKLKLSVFLVLAILSASGLCDVYKDNEINVDVTPWVASDYLKVRDIFSHNKVDLPRLKNKKDSHVFLKMVSDDNLIFFESIDVPFEQKVESATSIDQAIAEITAVYLKAHGLQIHNYEEEVANLFSFTVRLMAKGVIAFDEYSSLNKNLDASGDDDMRRGRK